MEGVLSTKMNPATQKLCDTFEACQREILEKIHVLRQHPEFGSHDRDEDIPAQCQNDVSEGEIDQFATDDNCNNNKSTAQRLIDKQQEYDARLQHKRHLQEQHELASVQPVPTINAKSKQLLQGRPSMSIAERAQLHAQAKIERVERMRHAFDQQAQRATEAAPRRTKATTRSQQCSSFAATQESHHAKLAAPTDKKGFQEQSTKKLNKVPAASAESLLAWQRERDDRVARKREEKLRKEQMALQQKPRLVNPKSEEILREAAAKQQKQQRRQQNEHAHINKLGSTVPQNLAASDEASGDGEKRRSTIGSGDSFAASVSSALSVADRLIAQGQLYQKRREDEATKLLRQSQNAKPVLATSHRLQPAHSRPRPWQEEPAGAKSISDVVGERLLQAAKQGGAARRKLQVQQGTIRSEEPRTVQGRDEEQLFQPRINKKSQQILARSKRHNSGSGHLRVEDRLLQRGEEYEMRQKQRTQRALEHAQAMHNLTVAGGSSASSNHASSSLTSADTMDAAARSARTQQEHIRTRLQQPIGHVREFAASTIEHPTFSPELNARSLKLSRRGDLRDGIHNAGSGGPAEADDANRTFLRNQQWKKRSEEKLAAKKQLQEEVGSQDCTFAPHLVSNRARRQRAGRQQAWEAAEAGAGGDLAARSQHWLDKREQKAHEMRQEREARATEGCTFNPDLAASSSLSSSSSSHRAPPPGHGNGMEAKERRSMAKSCDHRLQKAKKTVRFADDEHHHHRARQSKPLRGCGNVFRPSHEQEAGQGLKFVDKFFQRNHL